MADLNIPGESHAHSLIAAGAVDKTSDWSFSAEDGNKLLGSGGDDWDAYGKFHLGIDRDAAENTKGRFKYPFGKGGKVYRSALTAIKQRAGAQNDSAIEAAAGKLLEAADAKKEGTAVIIQAHGRSDAEAYPSIDAFRDGLRDNKVDGIVGVRASFDTEVKADGTSRELTFAISTASVDRMGDTIALDGWDLSNFRKNPVVLWAHDSSQLPVARAPNVWPEGGKLMAKAEFTPPGLSAFADTVFEMYKQKFLSATSVGFAPTKYAFTDDPQRRFGIDFLEQELLEFSCVPVPANAEALIEGKAAGIDIVPLLDWAEKLMRKAGDNARIIKLAESVLGKNGEDLVALSWAERIVCAAGKSILTPTRMASIAKLEKAATQERLRRARARDLDVIAAKGKL